MNYTDISANVSVSREVPLSDGGLLNLEAAFMAVEIGEEGSWSHDAVARLEVRTTHHGIDPWDSLDTQPGRLKSIQLWIALLVIEHMVLLLRVGFKQVHQSEPAWVQVCAALPPSSCHRLVAATCTTTPYHNVPLAAARSGGGRSST